MGRWVGKVDVRTPRFQTHRSENALSFAHGYALSIRSRPEFLVRERHLHGQTPPHAKGYLAEKPEDRPFVATDIGLVFRKSSPTGPWLIRLSSRVSRMLSLPMGSE